MDTDTTGPDGRLVVRRVLPVDLRGAAELLTQQLRARGREPDEQQLHHAVQAALEDTHGVLVAGAYHEGQPGFAHGKMVGVLLMNVLYSIEHAGEVGWIDTLYVRPAYRRRGLGEGLLQQAMRWSEARGLRALHVEFFEEHEVATAERLYHKHGFRVLRRSRMTLDLAALHPRPAA